jgi:acyl-coenzyme A synthetase/AMP-(fatty) acid ligase
LRLEKDIENRLKNEVEKRNGLCLKFTSPGHTGVPDRIVITPEGLTLFVELKKSKHQDLDPKQKHWKKRLTDYKQIVWVVKEPEDIDQLIEQCFI